MHEFIKSWPSFVCSTRVPPRFRYLEGLSTTAILGRSDTLLFRHFDARLDAFTCRNAATRSDAYSLR